MKYLKEFDSIAEKKLSTSTKSNVMKWVKRSGVELTSDTIDELRNNPTVKSDETVTLYRGLLFNELDIKSGMFNYKSDKPSSWTKDYNIACRFGKYSELETDSQILASFFVSMRRGQIDRNIGIVIKHEFRPEDVLLDFDLIPNKTTGRKFEYEKEVIISPTSIKCDIVTVFTKKGTYTPSEYLSRNLDNGYDKIISYLKSGFENIDTATIKKCETLFGGYSNNRKELDSKIYINRCLKFDKNVAYKLYKQFYILNSNKPELIIPEYGSDEKEYNKIKEIYRYLENFDSEDSSRGFSNQFTNHYYESELIADFFNKNVDRLSFDNRKKFSSKIEEMFKSDISAISDKYAFCSNFKGNVLFRMHQIVKGIKSI